MEVEEEFPVREAESNQLGPPEVLVIMRVLNQRSRRAVNFVVLFVVHGGVEAFSLGFSFEGCQELILHLTYNIEGFMPSKPIYIIQNTLVH